MIGYTKVWKVNKMLVVADTIEEAIKVYQDNGEFPYNEVKEVALVEYYSDTALIRKEDKK